jgi:hypothetical protein
MKEMGLIKQKIKGPGDITRSPYMGEKGII